MTAASQPSFSLRQLTLLTVFIFVLVRTIGLFLPPGQPEENVLQVSLEELFSSPEKHAQSYISVADAEVTDNFYLLGIGYYTISDQSKEYHFYVISGRIFKPGARLDLVCYVQQIVCKGERGCFVLLKEVESREIEEEPEQQIPQDMDRKYL